ncbi:hypothetical protein ACFPIK_04960 [Algoriphagus aquatilis]|uniref:DUF4468 domain-containing protein n=1 Tax=Algoriphagus aquatilis TaxID=490186 RepID=A0ABW0BTW6_9BACT
MKTILISTFFILLLFLNTQAQEIPKEYRSFNTMLIQLDKDAPEILELCAKALIEFDHEIEKIDKDYFTISTKPRLAKNVLNYYIKVKVIDQKAEFQIYSSMDISIYGINSEGYSLTNFKGQKGSANHEAVMKLFSVVNSLNTEIQFLEK